MLIMQDTYYHLVHIHYPLLNSKLAHHQIHDGSEGRFYHRKLDDYQKSLIIAAAFKTLHKL